MMLKLGTINAIRSTINLLCIIYGLVKIKFVIRNIIQDYFDNRL